jgi:hypothetical protein
MRRITDVLFDAPLGKKKLMLLDAGLRHGIQLDSL